MKRDILLFCVAWVVLGAASVWVFSLNGFVQFEDDVTPQKLATLAASFSALALIVERFVSIFVRDETIELVSNVRKVNSAKVRIAKLEDAPMNELPDVLPRIADEVQHVEVVEDSTKKTEKDRSQKFQKVALFAGLVVAALGFRFFGQVAGVAVGTGEPSNKASILFYVADVGLSGVLIGGGSSFVDGIIVFFRKTTAD
ncbi:MAG: hypothetical protein AAGI63_14225 [Planctomycetota bacterium]